MTNENALSLDEFMNNNGAAKNTTAENPAAPSNIPNTIMQNVSNNDLSKMTPVNPAELFANSPKREAPADPLMQALDSAVEREKNSISERINAIGDMQYKEFVEEQERKEQAALDEEDKFALGDNYVAGPTVRAEEYTGLEEGTNEISNTNKNENYPIEEPKKNYVYHNSDNDNDLADMADLPEVDDEDFEEDPLFIDDEDRKKKNSKILDGLKQDIKDRISPIKKKKFDLSTFTIAQKPMNAQKVMKLAVQVHKNTADWVLASSKRPISVSGLSGPEILKLNPDNSNRNRLNTFKDMYHVIYDHIIDGNKPEFETWLKQTKFIDLPHIYFAIYMATFGDSNFANYTCPKCKKVFIEDVKFSDMVSYKDDAIKEEIQKILKMDSTSPTSDSYTVDLKQVSDTYVFGLHSPSLWNIIIETASLSDQFIEKYTDLIDIVSFIDSIYVIDANNNQLIPVDTKPDANNQAKTSARRIKIFYDIIKTLNSEDYYSLRSMIADYEEDADAVTYKMPGAKCPDCGTEIPENTEIGPDAMLFTRHRLAAIGNM